MFTTQSLRLFTLASFLTVFPAASLVAQAPPRVIPDLPPVPWTQPTAQTETLLPVDAVDRLVLPPLNLPAVLDKDQQEQLAGLAPRYAEPIQVNVTPKSHGTWESIDPTTAVWRLRIASPGALSLNFGFTHFKMPPGGRMFIYSIDFAHGWRPFTDRDNADHGQLWTPPVEGDDVVIEITLPSPRIGALDVELSWVNVGFRRFGDVFTSAAQEKSGACNVDVLCPEGDPWRMEIPAVAVISTGGSRFCTGFMVNNTAGDLRPFFMTANHCGIGSSNAPSLVAFWNYQNSTCRPVGSSASGGAGNGSLAQFTTGSTFRATWSTSDFTLVELSSNPNPAWNISYAGWSRSTAEATSGACIHHPNCDEKRITLYNTPTVTVNSWSNTTPDPNGNHVHAFWSLGVTEPGSSGSPLFDQNHRIIGQLHGGPSACGAGDLSDFYGRFSSSWSGGGTSATRLSDWLDVPGTGAMFVDTISGGGLTVTPSGTVLSIGPIGGPFSNPTTTYNIANATAAPANYTVAVAPGYTAPILLNGQSGPLSGTIPNGSSDTVAVSFDSSATSLPAGLYTAAVEFTDTTNNLVTQRTHQLEIGLSSFSTIPATGLSAGGPVGGPFSAVQVYTVTSTRPTAVTVRVSAANNWVSLNGLAGPIDLVLPTDGSTANITVGFSAAASALPAGIHKSTITFSNRSGGGGDTSRDIILDVGRYTYAATDVPRNVADYASITSDIAVPDSFCIADVDVAVDIQHTYIGDLTVDLVSPGGSTVRLHNRNGGSTDDILRTYDDATLAPDGPGLLADFIGQQVAGTWRLVVSDQAGGDTGTLRLWALRIASAGTNCPTPVTIHNFPLNQNPGWNAEPDWAFGVPQGAGGDPSAAHTGSNVYGYNLTGAYANNMSAAKYLTAGPLNCTGFTGTRLRFQRWLGVESSAYDHATLQVSNDGLNWTTLWQNPSSTLIDAAWVAVSYDISAVADNRPIVYVRWGLGPTDSSVTYCGWNIDDVSIAGFEINPCLGVLPGDVSLDGNLDGRDVQSFVRVLMNPAGASPQERCAADCNSDAQVTSADAATFVDWLLQ